LSPGDVSALANALAEALDHPERLATMGRAARERVMPLYSAEAFHRAGESILERLRERGVLNAD